MEHEEFTSEDRLQPDPEEFDTLQSIVDELRLGGFENKAGPLVNNIAFQKLETFAKEELGRSIHRREKEVYDHPYQDEAFHIETDLYEGEDLINLLVVPVDRTFVVVAGNEHLCTLIQSADAHGGWEQSEGGLEEEAVDKLGKEISAYIHSF